MGKKQKQVELNVSAIRHGTVIDHIDSKATFQVARILQVEDEDSKVLVGLNLESKQLGSKGIIKVENRRLTPEEANKIALIAPEASVNIIENFKVVEKTKVELPASVERVVKCYNPRCVTNNQPVDTSFDIVGSRPPALRCRYCERVMKGSSILLK